MLFVSIKETFLPFLSPTVFTDLLVLNMQFKPYKSMVSKREVGLLLSVLLAVTLFIREDTTPFRKRNVPEEICGIGLLTFYTQS